MALLESWHVSLLTIWLQCPMQVPHSGYPLVFIFSTTCLPLAGMMNPDQRITEDVEKFCFAVSDL